jgi:hypothetical protein
MIKQYALTLITPVLASRKENLFVFLEHLKISLEDGIRESFENIGTIHYARWLVIDYDIQQGQSAMGDMPKLVLSSNFDGGVQQHIRNLSTSASDIIDSIYDCCEGYPPEADRTAESRIAYLNKWIVPTSASYQGSPGRSLQQIKNENNLRNFIRDFLDSRNWDNHSAKQVHQEMQKAVFARPDFLWVKNAIKLPRVNWWGLLLVGILLLILSPILIVWILLVQFAYERRDVYFTLKRSQLNRLQIKKLETYEDIEMQNQFSQLVAMKPGKVRLITFKFMMLFARTLVRLKFVKGKLMGIPTIHFASWVLFDNDKRVLFFSNFDGSWQQYLGDFIDKSGWGLTGIFSNTANFPKTKFLFTGGAYDEEHFLAWSRNSEIQTQVWYNAYPNLSIKNINNNSRIRYQLINKLTEYEAAALLRSI